MEEGAILRARDPSRTGFSGMETLVFLFIAGLIISTAAYFINAMRRETEITDILATLSIINMTLPEIYASQPDFGSGSLSGVVVGEGALPRKFVKSDSELVTPWGDFEIEGDGKSGLYVITLGNVPKAACQKIGLSVASSGTWRGLRIGEGDDLMGASDIAGEISSQCADGTDIFITGDKG